MAFVTYFVEMVVKVLLVSAVAYGGICLGKKLRDRKDAKSQKENAATSQ